MSRGLSRQQVAILLYMRHREEACYREYVERPQSITCCFCGRPCPGDGRLYWCYRCHLRWCKKCTTTSIDVVRHFWPDPPPRRPLPDDPSFRAWWAGLQRIAALMPRRRDFNVNYVHHTSVQRAIRGLAKRNLVWRPRRSRRGYQWAMWCHPGLAGPPRGAPIEMKWTPRVSVVPMSKQHLSGQHAGEAASVAAMTNRRPNSVHTEYLKRVLPCLDIQCEYLEEIVDGNKGYGGPAPAPAPGSCSQHRSHTGAARGGGGLSRDAERG